MKITPFDRYRDKNGKTYQVLTTAISLATEKEEVVVQQLYGHYINISIPEDKFLRIFTKIDDRENGAGISRALRLSEAVIRL